MGGRAAAGRQRRYRRRRRAPVSAEGRWGADRRPRRGQGIGARTALYGSRERDMGASVDSRKRRRDQRRRVARVLEFLKAALPLGATNALMSRPDGRTSFDDLAVSLRQSSSSL